MELKTIAEVIKYFAKFYNHSLDEFSNLVWLECLRKYTSHEVKVAFLEHVKNSRYFPKPNEIIDIIAKNKEIFSEKNKQKQPKFEQSLQAREAYHQALMDYFNASPEEKSAAWKVLQNIRAESARKYLLHLNGPDYEFKQSCIMQGS